ncbi:MAG: hypothetical protein J7K68_01840, partial [Candidatus Diapherotrites archaeon]|nr:hypothetical protein [Candidatus Diapherotrites archaeon]
YNTYSTKIIDRYKVDKEINGLIIVQDVPKSFADKASSIDVGGASYTVMEEDPVFKLDVGDVSEGDRFTITYTINKEKIFSEMEDIIKGMAPPEVYGEMPQTTEGNETNSAETENIGTAGETAVVSNETKAQEVVNATPSEEQASQDKLRRETALLALGGFNIAKDVLEYAGSFVLLMLFIVLVVAVRTGKINISSFVKIDMPKIEQKQERRSISSGLSGFEKLID